MAVPMAVENNLEVIATTVHAFLGEHRDPKAFPVKHGSKVGGNFCTGITTLVAWSSISIESPPLRHYS